MKPDSATRRADALLRLERTRVQWVLRSAHHAERPGGAPAGSDPDSAYAGIVVRTGHGDSINKAWRGVITKDGWKYCCFDQQTWLLFNLNEDPLEQVNLAHNIR